MQATGKISAVLTDVDGTLVTKDKVLTDRTIQAVDRLRDLGIAFTITSGRPPRGLRMLVDRLQLTTPMAAFNGGVIVLPDLSILDERLLPDYLLPALVDVIVAHGLDVWLFRSTDWFVRSPTAPRVDRETSNIQFPPIVTPNFEGVMTNVVKVVGVSNEHDRVARCEAEVQRQFGMQVSAARSQPHYLDVTQPTANKGVVIERLSRYLSIPAERIAALGDQLNDVEMFKRAGLSIAMGNASPDVQSQAMCVTTSNAEEGFANAIEQFVIPRAERATGARKATGHIERLGQNLWLDPFTRNQLIDGTLARCVGELSVSGAIISSAADIGLDDIVQAADLLRPAYDHTAGVDGWISLALAGYGEQGSADATDLLTRAARPNLMIAIPGARQNHAAIEDAIFRGVPVNITRLYSREQYLAAADVYLRSLERRIDAGLSPDVVSVASVDIGSWESVAEPALGLAMARRVYRAYRSLLSSPRWQRVFNAGARTQRLLWLSAAPGDSTQSRSAYIGSLVAPFTIHALPAESLFEFAAQGGVTSMLPPDGGDCEAVLAGFAAAGIDIYAAADRLQQETAEPCGTVIV